MATKCWTCWRPSDTAEVGAYCPTYPTTKCSGRMVLARALVGVGPEKTPTLIAGELVPSVFSLTPDELKSLAASVNYALEVTAPRELWEPIEIDKWTPTPDKPGYLTHAGRITVHELEDQLNERLKRLDCVPDEYGMQATMARYKNWYDKPVPACRRIACFPVTGGSEGHYIHVALIFSREVPGPDPCRCGHEVHAHASAAGAVAKDRCYSCECSRYVAEHHDTTPAMTLFLGKTFEGMARAAAIANACARLLS